MAVLSGRPEALSALEAERDGRAVELLEASDGIAAFDWTMDGLKARHKRMNLAMKAEVAVLADRAAGRAAGHGKAGHEAATGRAEATA